MTDRLFDIVKNKFIVILLMILALILQGCSSGKEEEEEEEEDVIISRTLDIFYDQTGGFDDFGGNGAALGYAIDVTNDRIFLVALSFQFPYYSGTFKSSSDYLGAAKSYKTTEPVLPLVNDVADYPLLASIITDTYGVRKMKPKVIAILVEGALSETSAQKIFVADKGEFLFTREDGPYDIIEADNLRFRQITGLGEGAAGAEPGEAIEINQMYFDWDTDEQP